MLRLIVASFLWLSFSIGLLAADEDTFVLVGSVSQLQDGDEVLIVNRESCLALSLDEKTNYVLPCNVDLSADGTEATVVSPNTAVLTLEKMSLGWRFYNQEKGWLWASDRVNYQLCFDKGKPSYKSNVAKITVGSNGDASIAFDVKNYKYLRCNGSDRFACYPSATSVKAVSIYRRQHRSDALALSEDGDNAKSISDAMGFVVGEITLQRSFAADGGYYSLCLPFAVSAAEAERVMPGAVFMKLQSVEAEGDGKVAFRFVRVPDLEAGKPYLLRLEGGDVSNPVFCDCTIAAATPSDATFVLKDRKYVFRGTFDRVSLKANGSTRFVSSDGKRLVTPNGEGQLRSMRAYFLMPDVQTGASFGQTDASESYVLTFPSATSLPECRSAEPAKGNVYSLSGVRSDMRTKGIKIAGGRKIMVR